METWRDIPGYEGIYLCSDLGRIKRIGAAQGAKVGRILKQTQTRDGRVVVGLSKDDHVKVTRVHQIVAYTFLGSPPDGKEVNHKNGDTADNRLSNLEYVTHQENQWHAYHVLGTLFPNERLRGEAHPSSKLTAAQVREIRRLASTGEYTNIRLGKLFGVSDANISDIVRHKAWKHID